MNSANKKMEVEKRISRSHRVEMRVKMGMKRATERADVAKWID